MCVQRGQKQPRSIQGTRIISLANTCLSPWTLNLVRNKSTFHHHIEVDSIELNRIRLHWFPLYLISWTELNWVGLDWFDKQIVDRLSHSSFHLNNIHCFKILSPLLTVLGTFPWPWEKKGKASALDEYGLGLVFYFKLLKSLAILFTVIAAVTIPSLGLYLSAQTTTSSTQKYTLLTHSGSLLGTKVSQYITHQSHDVS